MTTTAGQADVELLVICTGNTARSVMAGVMLGLLAERAGLALHLATGGTHATGGQPAGARTLASLAVVPELAGVSLSSHRSRPVETADLERADLVVAMEASHVRWVRRHHPDAASRTGVLRGICRELAPGPSSLRARVAAMGLASVALDPGEDVADPAGGDAATYAACALDLWPLCRELASKL